MGAGPASAASGVSLSSALERLSGQDEPRRFLADALDALFHRLEGKSELVLELPSPSRLLRQRGAEAPLDFGDMDDVATALTTVLRDMSTRRFAALVIASDEPQGLSEDEWDACGPLVKAARYYGWGVALRLDGVDEAPRTRSGRGRRGSARPLVGRRRGAARPVGRWRAARGLLARRAVPGADGRRSALRHDPAGRRAGAGRAAHASVAGMNAGARRPTPVCILTGHLGSGKTTLLQHALAHPSLQRTALIINEFGDVSIDHLLVAQVAENIVELRGGCICCAIRVDLVMTLRDLHEKRLLREIPDFDHVIVETSGLADPVPLLHTLMANPLMSKHFVPDAVVTCVDQVNFARTAAEDDVAVSQVQMADVLLMTKGDLASGAEQAATREQVRGLNPTALVLDAAQGDVDPALVFRRGLFEPGRSVSSVQGWLQAGRPIGPMRHGTKNRAHVITSKEPISLAGLAVFLNRITNAMRQDILRIKGMACVRERPEPVVIHAVREKFYPLQWLPHWPNEDRRTRLVFIGRQLDTDVLDRMFAELCL